MKLFTSVCVINTNGGELFEASPPPAFLRDLTERVSGQARFPEQAQLEVLVTRYQVGAGIGWHRDAPPFGPVIAGASLANACEFRLRLANEDHYDVYKTQLSPRSLYLLSGTARFRWQHAIPPVHAPRYSLTFRTIRKNVARDVDSAE